MEIRDRRLYRETHATFEAYCRERWGWGRDYADRQIDAAFVHDALPTTVGKPTNEHQARQMLSRLEPEEREQVRSGNADPEVVRKMTSSGRVDKSQAGTRERERRIGELAAGCTAE